jgi:hypothetical protein
VTNLDSKTAAIKFNIPVSTALQGHRELSLIVGAGRPSYLNVGSRNSLNFSDKVMGSILFPI